MHLCCSLQYKFFFDDDQGLSFVRVKHARNLLKHSIVSFEYNITKINIFIFFHYNRYSVLLSNTFQQYDTCKFHKQSNKLTARCFVLSDKFFFFLYLPSYLYDVFFCFIQNVLKALFSWAQTCFEWTARFVYR